MKDLSEVNKIIEGRVEPHIYAFTTKTVPNYLKVGETYRSVAKRLQEWKEYFPNLHKEYDCVAKLDDDTYFRDYSVHLFLEQDRHLERLKAEDLPDNVYFSKEFFKHATVQDVQDAIVDIKDNHNNNTNKYKFYSAKESLPITYHYPRIESFEPRPNQETAISRFNEARAKGRTNLLMYAVMRFGKSFTAMCCATEMEANIVVIVSAKADVREEWKKTVESHERFGEYVFFTSNDLLDNETIISDTFSNGKKVAVFLTLQDLQGNIIKEKHKEIFNNVIDLLIVDETHFGARAEKYSLVLRDLCKDGINEKDIDSPEENDDFEEYSEADKTIKILNARIKLHLSGTPYRILMGSEFSKDDIIAFCQFTDIVNEQEQWIKNNNASDEKKPDWENPYYGFPQMIRFAFNPNDSALQKLKELKSNGVTYAFSALFKPQSIKRTNNGKHKKFIYENEILDFLSVIDGSKDDDNVLGFLDYDKIKEGQMCRHIVIVLPYRASCDAMEELIKQNSAIFKNLSTYEILNISGVGDTNTYRGPDDIKNRILECENHNKKTITLTANRMLTGSTVEQWDTMIFLKDTSSPQEYDQAIFRLQNQYTKTLETESGEIMRINLKPQTLLVDFDPNRMFFMQEQKAQIYNVNIDEAGNSRLEERIREELRISPIIVMNENKLEIVQPVNILQVVSNYSKNRGVAEETNEIPVDLSLLNFDAVRTTIEKEHEIGTKGLSKKAYEDDGEGSDLDLPQELTKENPEDGNSEPTSEETEEPSPTLGNSENESQNKEENDNNVLRLTKKFRSYYARILFFAFLTRDEVISLEDIISLIDNNHNSRIAKNIGLSKPILEIIQNNINKFILRDLDYKIQHLNTLSHDETVEPIERAAIAVRKFGKLGESEVITSKTICDKMISLISTDSFSDTIINGRKFLDIAGKAGEFALSIYDRCIAMGYSISEIYNSIYTIPTSGITYEFTRLIYEFIGLNPDCIASKFNSYQLLTITDDNQKTDYSRIKQILTQQTTFSNITLEGYTSEGDNNVKFDVVVGNPPYQENIGTEGVNDSLGKQLFPSFMKLGMSLTSSYSTMIVPSKWFTGKAQDGSFLGLRKYVKDNNHFSVIVHCLDGRSVFPDVNTGSVMYYLYDKSYQGNVNFIDIQNEKETTLNRPLFEEGLDVIIPLNATINILQSVRAKSTSFMENMVTGRNPFGVPPNDRELQIATTDKKDRTHNVKILCAYEAVRYISRSNIARNIDLLDSWKVFTAKINGGAGTILSGKPASILGKTFVMGPNSACSNTLLAIGKFDSEEEANNLNKYMKTKFFRFMLGIKKNANVLTSNVYSFVPTQKFNDYTDIDWSKSIEEIDNRLFDKYELGSEEREYIKSIIKPME